MGKKVTLQELANNSNSTNETINTKSLKENVNEAPVDIKPAAPQNQSGEKLKEVSASDIRSTIPQKEKEEEKQEQKMPEIYTNAIADMVKTMEGKKKKFDEEIRPQIEAAREEAEIEAELAEAESNSSNTTSEEDDELDGIISGYVDIEEDDAALEEDEEATEEKKVTKVETLDAYVPDNSTHNEYKPQKLNTELDDEINSIDSLLGDIEQDMEETNEDIELDGEDDADEESIEDIRERLKKQSVKLKSTSNKVDTSDFKIRKKAINSSSILARVNKTNVQKTADWPLLATGRCHTFSEVSGPELEALQKTIQNSNSLNGIIASLRLVYNHIVDANKPGFERWCKLTKYEDLESLYFGLYKACYSDVNLIGRSCVKDKNDKNDMHCNKTSVIDTPIDMMYKIEDEEAKEKFNKLFEGDTTTSQTTLETTILNISDNFAVGYSDPTLYTTLIQFSSLSENIIRKHEAMLNTLAYIDGFYYIDYETKEYVPMQYKIYPDNLNKTIMSKLKLYIEICKLITPDQYDTMVSKIAANADKESKINYILPEAVCPECGATIQEEPAGSMLELLFTHRQLTAIANS